MKLMFCTVHTDKLGGGALCFVLDIVFSTCTVGTMNWSIVSMYPGCQIH